MLLQKEGLPPEGDLVLCTITKIHYHSVFATLDEYHNRSGMIHISEISPGRIRNINDFVQEGKKIVCKILRIDQEKGHIDLSLRRVSDNQKRKKIDEIKQEQKVEKILEFVAKQLKTDVKKFFHDVSDKMLKRYDSVMKGFEEVVLGNVTLEELGIDKAHVAKLSEVVGQRVKPPEVVVKGELKLVSFAPDGVELVKKALLKAEEKVKDKDAFIRYKGAGKFIVEVKDNNYKDAEHTLSMITETAISEMEKLGGQASFERKEAKK